MSLSILIVLAGALAGCSNAPSGLEPETGAIVLPPELPPAAQCQSTQPLSGGESGQTLRQDPMAPTPETRREVGPNPQPSMTTPPVETFSRQTERVTSVNGKGVTKRAEREHVSRSAIRVPDEP